jgi:hypothetical protein
MSMWLLRSLAVLLAALIGEGAAEESQYPNSFQVRVSLHIDSNGTAFIRRTANMVSPLIWSSQIREGHTLRNSYTLPLPYEYIKEEDLPSAFSWGNVGGVSFLTKSLNQHIPQVRTAGMFLRAMKDQRLYSSSSSSFLFVYSTAAPVGPTARSAAWRIAFALPDATVRGP